MKTKLQKLASRALCALMGVFGAANASATEMPVYGHDLRTVKPYLYDTLIPISSG